LPWDAGRVLDTGTPAALKAKTNTKGFEAAFVKLLPKEKRAGRPWRTYNTAF